MREHLGEGDYEVWVDLFNKAAERRECFVLFFSSSKFSDHFDDFF
jgi:hypothetical protein